MSSNWSSRFPVYQIDFVAAASGKRVASTKRRIRWRFGFPNKQALEAGQNGTDCRGEEHDVTVVWSITSGKRQITMDGREVHYSSSRAGILDFSWTTKGNHVLKVACHAAVPLTPIPGFRQYDLFIDGQSFFSMPKVYELGLKGTPSSRARAPGHGYGSPSRPIAHQGPTTHSQEEADLKRAIEASLAESRQHLQSKGADDRSAQTSDLLDFGSPAPNGTPHQNASDAMSYYSAPPAYAQLPAAFASPAQFQSPAASTQVVAGALVPSHGPPGTYYQAPPATPTYASPPPVPPAPAPTPQTAFQPAPPQESVYQPSPIAPGAPPVNYLNAPAPQGDVFGLNSMPGEDPFAPKPPTQQDFQNAILGAYQNAPPSTPTAAAAGAPMAQTPQANGTPTPGMSMNTLTNTAAEETPVSEFEKALKNLVNVDHIDEPAEGEFKLTMMKKEEAKKKTPSNKSVPLPPVGKARAGAGATLSQIKDLQGGERTLRQTADGVMNAPPPGVFSPGAAAAGALVVHGQGPPPLHQQQGFGLGAQLPNGGFSQQQATMGYQGYQQQYR